MIWRAQDFSVSEASIWSPSISRNGSFPTHPLPAIYGVAETILGRLLDQGDPVTDIQQVVTVGLVFLGELVEILDGRRHKEELLEVDLFVRGLDNDPDFLDPGADRFLNTKFSTR